MIDQSEIFEVANDTGLQPYVIEKDYAIGWVLAGIFQHPELRDRWIFKGGTCLKKCFFETYRFSEDLDFALQDVSHLDESFLSRVLGEVADWVYQNAGIEIPIDEIRVEIYTNPRGNPAGQGRIYFRNPLRHSRNSPGRIKLDLTMDEILVREPVMREVLHSYSDRPPHGIFAQTYDFSEVFAEKTRALAERTQSRDLYDVINLFRRPEAQEARSDIRNVLAEKCAFKGIGFPKYADLEPFRNDVAATWTQMLDHQLPHLLPFESFWNELPDFFRWLELKLQIEVTAPVRGGAGEVPVYATQPPSSVPTAPGATMGRIRFAAANRLLIDLDYEAQNGRRSRRLIEPYSLRLTVDDKVLLRTVRHDSGEPRAYRVDRIRGATITDRSFVPRYTIELTMTGPQAISPLSSQGVTTVSRGRTSMGRRVLVGQSTKSRLSARKGSARSRGIGPTYVYECTFCQRKFRRKKQSTALKPHKDKSGWNCSGRTAWLADTIL